MALPVKSFDEHRRISDDRGAIAAIFAILLGTGALLGMLALSFDLGAVYLERRTVQVGSDAAATGVAQKCALHSPQCQDQASAGALAAVLVNANAEDSLTGIEELCGVAPLSSCAPLSARYADCREPQFPDGRLTPADQAYVRVTTRTQTSDGSALRTVFSDLLDGQGGNSGGVTLWSCAQSAWGKVDSADVRVPLAFGACNYELSGVPVVTPAFPPDPRSASRPIPLTVDCVNDVYSTAGGVTAQPFTAVANGFAPISLGDPSCATDVPADVAQDFTLPLIDIRSLCGGSVGSFATYLDAILAQDPLTPGGLYFRYPVLGAVSQQAPPNDDVVVFDVRSFASYRLLGYRLKAPRGAGQPADYAGGQIPPGGWDGYPSGSTPVESCAQRSCLYGQFATHVVTRDRISVDPDIPNMGVQAVESLP